jgi:hypothetical protein
MMSMIKFYKDNPNSYLAMKSLPISSSAAANKFKSFSELMNKINKTYIKQITLQKKA